VSINANSQPGRWIGHEPSTRAHELVAFWHARWGSCERLSDVSFDLRWLNPWADDLAIFERLDYGADFRADQVARQLEAFFGGDCSGAMLSEFPWPYRQALRQVLLRASMIRAPAVEHNTWLVDGHVRSCIICAMPVAGGFYQPSHLLLAVFHKTTELCPVAAADFPRTFCSASESAAGASQTLPPSVSGPLPAETLFLGGGSLIGSAALSCS